MHENRSRHIETLLRNSAEAQARGAQAKATKELETSKNLAEQRRQIERPASNKLTDDTARPSASEMNELGWSFRSRTAKVGSAKIFDEFAEVASSFDDRFAAVLEVTSVSQPSIIQRMMDPVGAIP
jgi:hypothetical protein